jgi:aspartate dehydrogenase
MNVFKPRIGVIGCGAIGREICKAIDDGIIQAELSAVFDHNTEKVEDLVASLRCRPKIASLEEMLPLVDLVVESASQAAVREIAFKSLEAGRSIMVMSVGALADSSLLYELSSLARKNNCRIYVPSGALAGIDGVRSASMAPITSVVLTTSKPHAGLRGAPYVIEKKINLDVKAPTLIFEGAAREAVKAFPENVNVASTLGIAGIGFDKTLVRIIVDPSLKRNVHEITVEGAFGKLQARVENVPSPANPKTSYLAALSAIATLKKIAEPVQVGT